MTFVGSVELALGLSPMTAKVDAECRPVKGVRRVTLIAVHHPSTAARRQSPVVVEKHKQWSNRMEEWWIMIKERCIVSYKVKKILLIKIAFW